MVTRVALILLCLGLAAGAQTKPKAPASGNGPQDRHKGGADQGLPHSHHPYHRRGLKVHAFPGPGA